MKGEKSNSPWISRSVDCARKCIYPTYLPRTRCFAYAQHDKYKLETKSEFVALLNPIFVLLIIV
jgi:hypothetical protein